MYYFNASVHNDHLTSSRCCGLYHIFNCLQYNIMSSKFSTKKTSVYMWLFRAGFFKVVLHPNVSTCSFDAMFINNCELYLQPNRHYYIDSLFFSSFIILWVANAVAIFLICHPCLEYGQESSTNHIINSNGTTPTESLASSDSGSTDLLITANRERKNRRCNCLNHSCSIKSIKSIVFAIFLFFSFNLMNLAIMSFIGDYYYDRRASISDIFSILIPTVVGAVGWYFSSELVTRIPTGNSELLKLIREILRHTSDRIENIFNPPKEATNNSVN